MLNIQRPYQRAAVGVPFFFLFYAIHLREQRTSPTIHTDPSVHYTNRKVISVSLRLCFHDITFVAVRGRALKRAAASLFFSRSALVTFTILEPENML